MNKLPIKKLKEIFNNYPSVKLGYIFGSQARGNSGPNSDYDFAVYSSQKDSSKRFELRLELMRVLSDLLKTEDIDVVVLNDVDNPLLKFLIIKEGIVLKVVQPYKGIVEPQILNEYFDFILTFRRTKVLK